MRIWVSQYQELQLGQSVPNLSQATWASLPASICAPCPPLPVNFFWVSLYLCPLESGAPRLIWSCCLRKPIQTHSTASEKMKPCGTRRWPWAEPGEQVQSVLYSLAEVTWLYPGRQDVFRMETKAPGHPYPRSLDNEVMKGKLTIFRFPFQFIWENIFINLKL